MSQLTRFHARLLAFVVTVLWSSSWVLISVGFDDTALRPLTFAGMRYCLAAVVLGAWLSGRQRGRARTDTPIRDSLRSRLWPLALLGAVQYAMTQGSQFVAIEHQPAATTSLVLSTTPLLVAFGGTILNEPPQRRHLIGGAFAALGAATYFVGDLGASTIGMIAAVITVSSNAGSVLLGRSINRRRHLDAGVVTVVSMSTGAVMLLTVGIAVEGVPRLDALAVVILVWLAAVNTALAFTMWNVALRELPAIDAAAIQNTMGLQIPLLAWLALDQPLGLYEVMGLSLAGFGAWVAVTASTARHASRRLETT